MDAHRLGMEFGEFFRERLAAHALPWYVLGAAVLGVAQADHPLLGGLAGLVLALLFAFSWLVIWGGLIAQSTPLSGAPGVVLYCLVVLPFAPLLVPCGASIFLEARWRIRRHCPYAVPLGNVEEADDIVPARLPPPARSGGWLFPLLLGLWLGGKD